MSCVTGLYSHTSTSGKSINKETKVYPGVTYWIVCDDAKRVAVEVRTQLSDLFPAASVAPIKTVSGGGEGQSDGAYQLFSALKDYNSTYVLERIGMYGVDVKNCTLGKIFLMDKSLLPVINETLQSVVVHKMYLTFVLLEQIS